MTIYNGVAFLTDASGNNVISCDVGGDGSLSGCSAQGDATDIQLPVRDHDSQRRGVHPQPRRELDHRL